MQHIAITMPGRPILAPLLIECDGTREGISLAVEALIAKLDDMDGDPDIEANGDEADGSGSEDEEICFRQMSLADAGAGCLLSDDDSAAEPDVRALVRHHRDRIRATRCDVVASNYHTSGRMYVLRAPAAGCPIADPGEEQDEN